MHWISYSISLDNLKPNELGIDQDIFTAWLDVWDTLILSTADGGAAMKLYICYYIIIL